MRKLYELEMTVEEVGWLIFAVDFLREERDLGDELPPFAQELRAQRDRDEVGMTEILLNYQGGVQTEPEVITDRSIEHYRVKYNNPQGDYPLRWVLEGIASRVCMGYYQEQVDQRIEEEVKEYGDALDAVARGKVTIDKYGTIIEGTLKDSDIGPACLDWLRENAPDAYQEAVAVCSRVYNLEIDDLNTNFWDVDEGWFLHEVVCRLMREQAPDGYYFGAHLGDGADIGFHLVAIDEETLDQALEIFNHYGHSGGVCFGMCGHCTGKNVRCRPFTATRVDGGVLINGFVNPSTGRTMVNEVCSEDWLLDTVKGWK